MSITKEDVAHVARLARLAMTEDELEAMYSHFAAILEHFARLQEIDASGVEPTFHPLLRTNVTRPDQAVDPMSRDKILSNAPDADEECFLVPQIMEDE